MSDIEQDERRRAEIIEQVRATRIPNPNLHAELRDQQYRNNDDETD